MQEDFKHQVVTIREAVRRAKSEGMRISEYTLRRWIKTGRIPVRIAGNRVLLYYPILANYLQCENPFPPDAFSSEQVGIKGPLN